MPQRYTCNACNAESYTTKAAGCPACGSADVTYVSRAKKPIGPARCVDCGAVFHRRTHVQTRCPICAKKHARYLEKLGKLRRGDKRSTAQPDTTGLGPDNPLYPMRKCHEAGCNELTYDYRCDTCKERFRQKYVDVSPFDVAQAFGGRIAFMGNCPR